MEAASIGMKVEVMASIQFKRQRLINVSSPFWMTCGDAYGPDIYLYPFSNNSAGYSAVVQTIYQKSQFTDGFAKLQKYLNLKLLLIGFQHFKTIL